MCKLGIELEDISQILNNDLYNSCLYILQYRVCNFSVDEICKFARSQLTMIYNELLFRLALKGYNNGQAVPRIIFETILKNFSAVNANVENCYKYLRQCNIILFDGTSYIMTEGMLS